MTSRLPLLFLALGLFNASAADRQTFWRVSGGAAYRQLGDLHWNTGIDSPAYLFQLRGPDLFGGNAGPADSASNRLYVDGFVNTDANTPSNGSTWFWGYTDNAQLQNGALVFHTEAGAYSTTNSTQTSGDWTDGNLDGFGPVLQVEWVHRINPSLSWSILGSAFFTQFNSDHLMTNFTAVNTTGSLVDRYDLGGFVIPSAPYSGDLAGPGPTIPNIPTQRTVGDDITSTTYTNQVRQSFDLNLVTLSLGPTIEWHHQRWGAQASAGLALNIAHWRAEQWETLQADNRRIAQWLNRESNTEALAGAYLQASVHYALQNDWHISAFVRYDWSQGIEAQVGPSTVTVDLDTFSAGIMIGRTF